MMCGQAFTWESSDKKKKKLCAPKLATVFRLFAIDPHDAIAAILMEVAFGTNMAAMTRHDVTYKPKVKKGHVQ